jgi:hypothetical protein
MARPRSFMRMRKRALYGETQITFKPAYATTRFLPARFAA